MLFSKEWYPPGVVQWSVYRTIKVISDSLVQGTIISHQNECNSFLTSLYASTLPLKIHSPTNNQEWYFQKCTWSHSTLQLKPQPLNSFSLLFPQNPHDSRADLDPQNLSNLISWSLCSNKFSFSSPNITNSFQPQGFCICFSHHLGYFFQSPPSTFFTWLNLSYSSFSV